MDVFSQAKRSWIMSRVRASGTRPEVFVRNGLRRAGIRYSSNCSHIPGHPDFVLRGLRLAVFVNGCFWHWHGCARCRWPKTHRRYWRKKIASNVLRDRQARKQLHAQGWRYATIWECALARGLQRLIKTARSLQTKAADRGLRTRETEARKASPRRSSVPRSAAR
jgi:DNA mismatch endonuclease (patch repair protein)